MLLREFQKHFRNSYRNHLNLILNKTIKMKKLPAEKALQIYHNNFYTSLTDCLQKIYSKIYKLVGDECFQGIANKYINLYPPTSGNINEYGSHFANLLANHFDNQAFPYLIEVAQLEWAYHQAFHAEDYGLFNLNLLKTLNSEQYSEIKFKLNPSVKLFSFNHPILHIWQICQNENNSNEIVNLSEGSEKLIIFKCNYDVFIDKLSRGEYEFIYALIQNYNFARVCTIALQAESTMNIEGFLQKCLSCGTIVGLQ